MIKEAATATDMIERRAEKALALEKQVGAKIAALKEQQDKINAEWKAVEALMIQFDVKNIKGNWGSLTIAERLNWSIDHAMLPAKFWKKVPDTTKISSEFRLYGKSPKGCEPSYTKFLTKRLKGADSE